MINVLINAYAVNPYWGSEQGMGWNWVIHIAKSCHVYVITEGEFRKNIEDAVASLPQKEHLHFYYNPLPDRVRRMCWNQGDWRFYWYYRKWQKRTLEIAKRLIAENRIDVMHQLNMIGFREPGYLWKIEGIPFVWGPIGGMELMPMEYLAGAPTKQRFFNSLKNLINRYQYLHSTRVRSAIQRADILISAVKGVKDTIADFYQKESILINETGVDIDTDFVRKKSNPNAPLKIIWVGKFDFRKQLPIALRAVIAMNRRDVELHICGAGSNETTEEMKQMAEAGGIASQCYWHGNVPHDRILEMMASSDVMLFTSIMEATSTVVLEAITVGLPVLCFNTCGFGPIVKDFAGVTIELTNPHQSVQDFAKELLNLYKDRTLLDEISARILEKRFNLTWEAKAQTLIRLYKSIIKFEQ